MANNLRIQGRSDLQTSERGSVSTEVSRVTISFVAILGVAVGVWSLACMVAGLAASGGPLQFISSWFKAVTGM